MSNSRLFLDSRALFAGIASPNGAARVLLLLGESGQVRLIVSEQVIVEVERALARKLPQALKEARQAILTSGVQILPDPPRDAVLARLDWISHAEDAPILAAAALAEVDFLVTLNRKHFLDDPQVSARSGLRMGTPGDALGWVREQIKGVGR
jgi:predicted nucleic acid-binding protein